MQPDLKNVRVYQHPGRIDTKSLESCDQLLLILPERPGDQHFKRMPQGTRLQQLFRKHRRGAIPAFTAHLPNKRQTLVVAGSLQRNATTFDKLTLGRRLVAAAGGQKAGSLGIAVLGVDEPETIAGAVLAAALAAAAPMPSFRKKPWRASIRSVRLLGLAEKIDTARIEAEALGNNLARFLAAMPPNLLDARAYAELAHGLATARGWHYKRFDTAALSKLGAGAFLAVAQGNDDDSAGIVRLRYRPGKQDARADLALVGKGIIFDTGGTNLKPANSMLDMHGDMQGSSVALGTLLAIDALQLPIAVDCWLALTENRTGPRAYKQQDVVTAANGKTIQTVHTDAEGRMALADALVLASRDEPALILDFATLTGTCIAALSKRYSGIFTNRAELHPHLKRIGQASGERVWPFPIGGDFADGLKSEVADLLQCALKSDADHILAATFLAEFVDNDLPWVHIDLSAGEMDGGLGHVATRFTGFGVRYALSLVLDEDLLRNVLT